MRVDGALALRLRRLDCYEHNSVDRPPWGEEWGRVELLAPLQLLPLAEEASEQPLPPKNPGAACSGISLLCGCSWRTAVGPAGAGDPSADPGPARSTARLLGC